MAEPDLTTDELRELYIQELMHRYKKLDYYLASLVVDDYLNKANKKTASNVEANERPSDNEFHIGTQEGCAPVPPTDPIGTERPDSV